MTNHIEIACRDADRGPGGCAMTFREHWSAFRRINKIGGPLEMRLEFIQWMFLRGQITLEERNAAFAALEAAP